MIRHHLIYAALIGIFVAVSAIDAIDREAAKMTVPVSGTPAAEMARMAEDVRVQAQVLRVMQQVGRP